VAIGTVKVPSATAPAAITDVVFMRFSS
jgi:hypothetical protein